MEIMESVRYLHIAALLPVTKCQKAGHSNDNFVTKFVKVLFKNTSRYNHIN